MGGLCTTTTEELPTSDLTVTGTGIPSYVAEGGKRLFEQAAELASGDIPEYTGPRIATYGDDASKLTPEEQEAFDLLVKGSDIYQPYLDQAFGATLGLGLGFDSAGRDELVQNESSEIEIITEFLPKQLGEEETVTACDQAIKATEAKSLKEIGKVIKYLKENSPPALDMSLASKLIKEKLQNL